MCDDYVGAPYNFVPLSEKIGKGTLVPHNCLAAQDNGDALLSGELSVTLEAETPLFVSNADRTKFYKTPDDVSAIPGSSLRGLIRQNMQILGFSPLRAGKDLYDTCFYFRGIAEASNIKNADSPKESWKNNRRIYYKNLLGVKSEIIPNCKKAVPYAEKVKHGYIFKKDNRYYIRPVSTKVYSILKKVNGGRNPILNALSYINNASVVLVWAEISGDKVVRLLPRHLNEFVPRNMIPARLLSTGPMRNQSRYYLFPEMSKNDEKDKVVSAADVDAYQMDYESRFNSLKGFFKNSGNSRKSVESFWGLPKEGESKPIFYLEYDQHLNFGMSQFLRIGYPHSVCDGLPESHKSNANVIDYASAILGFTQNNEQKSAYRSRVGFEDLRIVDSANNKQSQTHLILMEPKPSFCAAYLQGKENIISTYVDDDFSIRGYKQYWLHEPVDGTDAGNLTSALYPYKEGTRFHGVIHFHNLRQEELGLLLWCIKLNKNCHQSIGMGKPYGYGRCNIHIDKLTVYNESSLYDYAALTGENTSCMTNQVDAYIDAYREHIAGQLYSGEIAKLDDALRDFFYIKTKIFKESEYDKIRYMSLKQNEFQNVSRPLDTIKEIRNSNSMQS